MGWVAMRAVAAEPTTALRRTHFRDDEREVRVGAPTTARHGSRTGSRTQSRCGGRTSQRSTRLREAGRCDHQARTGSSARRAVSSPLELAEPAIPRAPRLGQAQAGRCSCRAFRHGSAQRPHRCRCRSSAAAGVPGLGLRCTGPASQRACHWGRTHERVDDAADIGGRQSCAPEVVAIGLHRILL